MKKREEHRHCPGFKHPSTLPRARSSRTVLPLAVLVQITEQSRADARRVALPEIEWRMAVIVRFPPVYQTLPN